MEVIRRSGEFSELERVVIGRIAAAVIPADEGFAVPAADDPLILPVILDKVAEQFADRVRASIGLLLSEHSPQDLSDEALLDLLEGDARFRSLNQMLNIAIMQGYYQDARVLGALGLEARPPFPLGHEVEPGDWSLLAPVKERGALYRPAGD